MELKLTKEEALEFMALAVYHRRRRNNLLEYGGPDGDMRVAKDVMVFFDEYQGEGRTSLDASKFEDYKHYLPIYEFLKEHIFDGNDSH